MQTELFDPLEAERLERIFSDKNARQRVWEAHGTQAPLEDLSIFFKNLRGKRVLDVGCGWGYYVHEFLSNGIRYHGIDLSPEMIRIAKDKNPGARFHVMSYRNLPFPFDAFDGLWCCCVFGGEPKHNMPNILTGLKNVLKPGGIMTVIMPIVHGSVDELSHDDDGDVIGWHAGYEPDELRALLEGVGFAEVTSYNRWQNGAASVMVRK